MSNERLSNPTMGLCGSFAVLVSLTLRSLTVHLRVSRPTESAVGSKFTYLIWHRISIECLEESVIIKRPGFGSIADLATKPHLVFSGIEFAE